MLEWIKRESFQKEAEKTIFFEDKEELVHQVLDLEM